MKKILAILIVGILAVSIPTVSSISLMHPKLVQQHISETPIKATDIPDWADGNISGVYAEKNDTAGYDILGTVFGYYHVSWEGCGYYAGVWETLDGNTSGCFSGLYFYSIALGQYNVTDSEETGGFIGLFKTNESDMTIKSVALVGNDEDHFIRYSLCSYTVFE
jgi:hypothetical protein